MCTNGDRNGCPLDGEIMDAWRRAVDDLGIGVEIPK